MNFEWGDEDDTAEFENEDIPIDKVMMEYKRETNVEFDQPAAANPSLVNLKRQVEELESEARDLKKRNGGLCDELVARETLIRSNEQELMVLRQQSMSSQDMGPPNPQALTSQESRDIGSPRPQVAPPSPPVVTSQESQGSGETAEEVDQRETNLVKAHHGLNVGVLRSSALGMTLHVRVLIFAIAFGGLIFVLMMSSPKIFGEEHAENEGDTLPVIKHAAFCMTCAAIIAFLVNIIQQPLILGYLLGGVLVGPYGLEIVPSHQEVSDISSLGLVFLLFMVGLELDVMELLKMGKIVLVTGAFQFPLCTGLHYAIFLALTSGGLSFGQGKYPVLYPAMCCGISSTMIVVKQLSEQGDASTKPGRLTIGILIFQDIWAIIVIAIQPNLAQPDPLAILKLFAWIVALVAITMLYAKYIMPVMLATASKTVELMLVLSLAWCFFVGSIAILPFIGLPLELACLVAGVGLATFPYSNEFNGKIRYIRDFFITLFFVGLGMQIPNPEIGTILTAVVIAIVVLIVRWVAIFVPVVLLGGSCRLGGLATINLSEVSEFALVICSLGVGYGHVDSETLTILIWTFSFLAILSSYFLKYNQKFYSILAWVMSTVFRIKGKARRGSMEGPEHHDERHIILLGFHRIAAMLIDEFEFKSPKLLKQLHVIDTNEDVRAQLAYKDVQFTYGDYTSDEVLHHAHHGDAHIVISTIPDFLLKGTTNLQLLHLSQQVWPNAYTVMTSDNPTQAMELYGSGANYVLRSSRLVAERIQGLLADFSEQLGRSQLANMAEFFVGYMEADNKRIGKRRISQGLFFGKL